MSSEQNEKDLIAKNPQSVETKKLPRVKSELNPKMNKSENYATMADDPYFEKEEERYNDGKTVDRAMTVYGEPDQIDEEDKLAITKETIFVKEFEYASLAKKQDLLTAYKYLYGACFRGHIHVANFLLHKCRISPFIQDPETSISPFMAAIEGN